VVFKRNSSPQTRAVLEDLLASPGGWRHGYDIARRTGLASGTLYPILGRLSDGGLLETRWEDDPPEGRPRRHLYRLTAEGAALAANGASIPKPGGMAGAGNLFALLIPAAFGAYLGAGARRWQRRARS
jgi:DNA-binding PadR family transcriptional regulator